MTREQIAENYPDVLFADGFDEAIIGICCQGPSKAMVCYDRDHCIKILMKDMSEEEAEEYFEFNVQGAWVGEETPAFLLKT